MSVVLRTRNGRLQYDIKTRTIEGLPIRERRNAPTQDADAAMRWAKRREKILVGCTDPGDGRVRSAGDHVGWVYFIRAGEGAIKIGWAIDPQKRLDELQCGNHEALVILATTRGTRDDERAFHRRFADDRIRREWFRPSLSLLQHVDQLKIGTGVEHGKT